MEKNLNPYKWCSQGKHSVAKLWWSEKPSRPSACKQCAMNIKAKEQFSNEARKPEQTIKRHPTLKPDKIKDVLSAGKEDKSVHVQYENAGFQLMPIKKERNNSSIPELLRLAEVVFNKWIRNRDRGNHGYTVCISCGVSKMNEAFDCGHFYPKTYSALRFDEDNCHAECIECNRMNDKHLYLYEAHLKIKIGLERFKSLQVRRNETKKWDRQELLDIIKKYKL